MLNQIPVMNIFFNDWTAVFTSIGTAMPYTLAIYLDWPFAFVIFGVTVMIAGHFMSKKGAKKEQGV